MGLCCDAKHGKELLCQHQEDLDLDRFPEVQEQFSLIHQQLMCPGFTLLRTLPNCACCRC